MPNKEWTRATNRTCRAGDRVTVGDVREALGDLPDDADLVVCACDLGGSDLPIEAVEVASAETVRHPWREFARVVAIVDVPAGGSPSRPRETPPTSAARRAARRAPAPAGAFPHA